MIDLPIAEDEPEIELHPRILLYNHLLGVISLILVFLSAFLLYLIFFQGLYLGPLSGFVVVVLFLVIIIQLLDLISWYWIYQQNATKIKVVSKYYMIPVIIDVLLVFAFGLGMLPIFLRVVIWGNINPDSPYFDEEDPLFSN